MALHFERSEYAARLERLTGAMQAEKLDAMLLFAQESMYWLTGYDTFGYCFFQCLVVKADGLASEKPGQTLRLGINAKACHLFDKDGKAVINGDLTR